MAEPQHLAQWACEGADAAQAMVRIIQLYPSGARATAWSSQADVLALVVPLGPSEGGEAKAGLHSMG